MPTINTKKKLFTYVVKCENVAQQKLFEVSGEFWYSFFVFISGLRNQILDVHSVVVK